MLLRTSDRSTLLALVALAATAAAGAQPRAADWAALEILATPGRITMLGEDDGNRMRRIHTYSTELPTE
jgi:hypothetical protein